MPTSEPLAGRLPAPIQSGLDWICEQLQQALGEELVTVVLYGGLAEGEYSPESSDVNVMVVLK